ncbi:hypothetical protein OJ998_25930 [Solirubrobacter taibaiensis]|nr:hypothetical protein [Solirubrobacter taibaiensis]
MSDTVWGALSDGALATWQARAADQSALARAVLAAGADTRVFRLASADRHGGDLQPVDEDAAAENRFRVDLPEGRRLVTPGTICWHENGTRREGEIVWLGALLEHLRPDALERESSFMGYQPPVAVRGGRGSVTIELATDIWFPRTVGLLEEDAPWAPAPASYDNADLAACHTPRLNAFLAAIREAADEWELLEPEEIGTRYADMVDTRGILLP